MHHFETLAIAAGRPARQPDADLNPPISISATYHAGGPMGYGRWSNSTWVALEETISQLESATFTLSYASGMAATSAFFALFPHGTSVIASNQGYSGTVALLQTLNNEGRLAVSLVDICDTDAVLALIDKHQVLWLESPTNPNLDVAELPALIAYAKAKGLTVAVDNTFATSMNQQPLAMGADIVMHAVTKYLSGHSDILMGSLSMCSSELHKRLDVSRRLQGGIPGPFEAWIALRGIRTFPLRFQRAQENALELATRLSKHPQVIRVRYPGLPGDPQHDRAKSFMKGFGAVVSFELPDVGGGALADRVCESSKLITYATSLGGVESLWERRRRWPSESPCVSDTLIRLSVGCEHVDDLWADIVQALDCVFH